MGVDHRASHSRGHSMHRYQNWRKEGVELACVGDGFGSGQATAMASVASRILLNI